ncbi:MAG: Trk system potassium transporter TrkA [Muribaculaceae bacterium]|nr:Trk system potassium transporter TrkA [Muribaculaceae bacterium]MDY3932144.1 Trk system potassium transporter TrkA [Muribaculaceae bacterium]
MKIIIVGAGEVGSHLAKLLSKENQDVILVDSNESKLSNLDSYNLMTFVGSPTSFKTLKSVNIDQADLFIAVTPYETQNISACSMAHWLGAKYTVARIDNYEYLKPQGKAFFKSIGVDELIYPELLAAEEIKTALKWTWVRNWFEMYDGEIIVIGVKVRDNARLTGMHLKDLASLSSYFHISAIKRNQETIIPRGDDYIKSNDILYFATTKNYVDNIRELCGKKSVDVKRVLIMGGSRIAIQLAKISEGQYKFKIIESNREKSIYLAERLPEANIVNGDGRDIDLLNVEGIHDYDAFIALTDSSEANILGCLTAKEMGVAKTIAEVETIQFINEAENLNIGTIVNKKLLSSSKIFQILLDSDTSNSKCLALADAEVAELVVKPKSKITKGMVKDLNLSRDMTIAGLIRDGKGMLVNGNTTILPGDHVVIFCLDGAIHKVEKLFS